MADARIVDLPLISVPHIDDLLEIVDVSDTTDDPTGSSVQIALGKLLDWSFVQNKPSTFTPSSHTHSLADITQSGATTGQVPQWTGSAWTAVTITSGVSSFNTRTGAVTLTLGDTITSGTASRVLYVGTGGALSDNIAVQILTGGVVSGGDDVHLSLGPSTRRYRIGTYDAAGAMILSRSDSGIGLVIQPDSDNLRFGPSGTSNITISAVGGLGSSIVISGSDGGGATPIQFGRRRSDNNVACGAEVQCWPNNSQTTPALAVMAPGGASYQLQFRSDGMIRWSDLSSSSVERPQVDIDAVWANNTDSVRSGRLTLSTYYITTAQEGIRIDANSGGVRLGFNGSAAIAKPTITGSRGSNVALASLLTALANYGLITDSTS